MPSARTDKPDPRTTPAARPLIVAGASVAAAISTAVAVPGSVASEPLSDLGPAHGAAGAQLRQLLHARANRWPRLARQWPSASRSPKRTIARSSNSTGGYSIPASIVMCESGGDYHAVNSGSGAGGAYQILPSTWAAYGGSGLPQDAPPAEQDAIAAKIYATDGRGAWSC
jgi:hypothetical protein